MKNYFTEILFASLLIMFSTDAVQAQVTDRMNYQAIARNAAGNILANQPVSIRVTIEDGIGGTPLYVETFTDTTNQFGLFTLEIGNGTFVSGDYSTIPWQAGNQWLKIEMDPTGGNSYIVMGESQLLSVPYSNYAAVAGSAVNGLPTNNVTGSTDYIPKFTGMHSIGNSQLYDNDTSIGIGTTLPQQKLHVNGGIKIGDAPSPAYGSMRFNTGDFQGYTWNNRWESLTKTKSQQFNGLFNSAVRNSWVFSPDSLVIDETGTYFIIFNVQGNGGGVFTSPFSDVDVKSESAIYKTSIGNLSQSIPFFIMYNDQDGATGGFLRSMTSASTTSTISSLTAGDVLKVSANVTSNGNPTSLWGMTYQIQALKLR